MKSYPLGKTVIVMLMMVVIVACSTPDWILKHELAHCDGYGHNEVGDIDYSKRIWDYIPPEKRKIYRGSDGVLESCGVGYIACAWRVGGHCFVYVP